VEYTCSPDPRGNDDSEENCSCRHPPCVPTLLSSLDYINSSRNCRLLLIITETVLQMEIRNAIFLQTLEFKLTCVSLTISNGKQRQKKLCLTHAFSESCLRSPGVGESRADSQGELLFGGLRNISLSLHTASWHFTGCDADNCLT